MHLEGKQNNTVGNVRGFPVPTFITVIWGSHSFRKAQFCIVTPHRNSRAVDNLFQPDRMINDQMMPAPSPAPMDNRSTQHQNTLCLHPHSNEDAHFVLIPHETCLTPVWRSSPSENFTWRLCVKQAHGATVYVCLSHVMKFKLNDEYSWELVQRSCQYTWSTKLYF